MTPKFIIGLLAALLAGLALGRWAPQADIRRALVHLGRAPIFRRFEGMTSDDEAIEELVVATGALAALVVVQIGLGAWTVLSYVSVTVAALHQFNGMAVVAAAGVWAVRASTPTRPDSL